jgi:hypothetical protein
LQALAAKTSSWDGRKEVRTLKLLSLLAMTIALGVAAAPAAAAAPEHDSFSGPVTADNPCSFPLDGDLFFTNDVTTFFDDQGNVTALQLHQSLTGTVSAKGTTLRFNTHEQIFVDFSAGTVKEVGVLDSIWGPNGPIFFRTGYALTDLATGVRLARHGVLDFLEPGEFCAAFG